MKASSEKITRSAKNCNLFEQREKRDENCSLVLFNFNYLHVTTLLLVKFYLSSDFNLPAKYAVAVEFFDCV